MIFLKIKLAFVRGEAYAYSIENKGNQKMTPSELKYQHETTHPDSHFFDRKIMKFFGDTMKNYGVRSCGECWELYRKRPVKSGLRGSAYFNKATFGRSYK